MSKVKRRFVRYLFWTFLITSIALCIHTLIPGFLSLSAIKKEYESLVDEREACERECKQLEQEISTRSRSAKLPKQRQSRKKEVPFFLRGGRLSAYARRGRDGELVPNTTEFVEKRDARGRYVEPKPGAGISIDLDGRSGRTIRSRFAGFNKDQHYVAVFVWPDSFAQFAMVKDVLVGQGFE